MLTDKKGRHFIARREAIVLVAYPDGPHNAIGCGHNGPDVKDGDTIDVPGALKLLCEDVLLREPFVKKFLKVEVEQYQWNMLMSFYYQRANREDGFRRICDRINEKDWEGVYHLWPTYDNNSKGERKSGLRRRRELELLTLRGMGYWDLNPVPLFRTSVKKPPEDYWIKEEEL